MDGDRRPGVLALLQQALPWQVEVILTSRAQPQSLEKQFYSGSGLGGHRCHRAGGMVRWGLGSRAWGLPAHSTGSVTRKILLEVSSEADSPRGQGCWLWGCGTLCLRHRPCVACEVCVWCCGMRVCMHRCVCVCLCALCGGASRGGQACAQLPQQGLLASLPAVPWLLCDRGLWCGPAALGP